MFICNKCGLCCMNVNKSQIYSNLDRGDGICKYFDEDSHLCMIYDNRPLVCNIDKMYEVFFSDSLSLTEYYNLNYKSCEILRRSNRCI